MALEPKTYLWIGLSLCLNVGASVTNTFGPLIINGLGFDKFTTALLNMPFGFLQFIIILFASWAATRFRLKSAILLALIVPVIAGIAMLYALGRTKAHEGALLAGYYLLAFLFGGNPLIAAWIISNTAGTTKKSAIMSVYNAASSAGNIIGPLLFNKKDAPAYHPGLRSVLAIFITLAAVTVIQAGNLMFLNKLQEKKRVKVGKPAKIKDLSMESHYKDLTEDTSGEGQGVMGGDESVAEQGHGPTHHAHVGDNAFLDLSDRKNEDFIYVY